MFMGSVCTSTGQHGLLVLPRTGCLPRDPHCQSGSLAYWPCRRPGRAQFALETARARNPRPLATGSGRAEACELRLGARVTPLEEATYMMKLPKRHATSRLRAAGSRASRRGHECDFTNPARGPTYLSG
jgi:hypothetical protein